MADKTSKLLALIRGIWKDPVLSQLISYALVALAIRLATNPHKTTIDHLSIIAIVLFVFSLWISCFVLFIKKRPINEDILLGKEKAYTRAYPKRLRRIALTGVLLIPIISACSFLIYRHYKSLPVRKIVILVANFIEPDPQNNRVTQNIYERLRRSDCRTLRLTG
jgi:hypothetical protein